MLAGPPAAAEGRAGPGREETAWPRARLTCRASPRPTQVPAPHRPISAPGFRQVCPPGSHRPAGRQLRDAGHRAGGRPRTHSCPRLARPGAQVEQKPGQRAPAGAAAGRASKGRGGGWLPASPELSLAGGGRGRGVTPRTLSLQGVPQRPSAPPPAASREQSSGLHPPLAPGPRPQPRRLRGLLCVDPWGPLSCTPHGRPLRPACRGARPCQPRVWGPRCPVGAGGTTSWGCPEPRLGWHGPPEWAAGPH